MPDPRAPTNAHTGRERARRDSTISRGSSGRRFKSCQPDAGQRVFWPLAFVISGGLTHLVDPNGISTQPVRPRHQTALRRARGGHQRSDPGDRPYPCSRCRRNRHRLQGVHIAWSETSNADDWSCNLIRARCEGRYAVSVFRPLGVVQSTIDRRLDHRRGRRADPMSPVDPPASAPVNPIRRDGNRHPFKPGSLWGGSGVPETRWPP